VTYGYNSLNELVRATEPDGAATTFSYDVDGNRTRIGYPNGVTVTQTYDAFDRLTQILARNATGSTLLTRTYAYLADGTGDSGPLVRTVTNEAGEITTYTYDVLNRLTDAKTVSSSGTTLSDYTYTYDGAGNLQSWSPGFYSGQTTSATYNAANEMTFAGFGNSAYDTAGDQLATDDSAFAPSLLTFNPRQQLQISHDSTVHGSSTTFLTYTGRQGDGLASASYSGGAETTYERNGSARVYFLRDKLGSVVATTDRSGNLTQRVTYDPYGGFPAKATPPDFTWLGEATPPDLASEAYHFGHRDYDPASHRFLQPDPVRHDTDITQANPYVYAGDDPVNSVDPDGQSVAIPAPAWCWVGGHYKDSPKFCKNVPKPGNITWKDVCRIGGGLLLMSPELRLEKVLAAVVGKKSAGRILRATGIGSFFGC
jgi:RHS repeat-associated protein